MRNEAGTEKEVLEELERRRKEEEERRRAEEEKRRESGGEQVSPQGCSGQDFGTLSLGRVGAWGKKACLMHTQEV